MSNLERHIQSWREKMLAAFPRQQEFIDELEDHLRESIAALTDEGRTAEEALSEASRRIGDPEVIALEYRHTKTDRSAWMKQPTKTLRIFVTVVLGLYLAAMTLQFIGICLTLFREGLSPFAPKAPAEFFSNLLVVSLSTIALWALWTKRWRTSRFAAFDGRLLQDDPRAGQEEGRRDHCGPFVLNSDEVTLLGRKSPMTPKIIVRFVSFAACVMAISVLVYHQSRGSLGISHFAIVGVQLALAVGIWLRFAFSRWVGIALWLLQASSAFALSFYEPPNATFSSWLRTGTALLCFACALLLLTPPASSYFRKRA